jgi:hypothetical protein
MWTLQTHYMGDFGSYVNHYALGEMVKELAGLSVHFDGKQEGFIGDCPECGAFFDFGADIVGGKVSQVFLATNEVAGQLL